MSDTKSLLARLHQAQEAANAVSKQGYNKAQNYNYARAEDVIAEARKALHGAGLVGTMTFSETQEREITSKGGGAGIYITLTGALRIADPDTGEILETPGFGAGIDYPGDKAIYKAMTGAAKYAYASALGIPFGDDPEDDEKGGNEERAPADAPAISDKQVDLIDTLLKRAKVADSDRLSIAAWAKDELTGGRDGTCSKAIDGLMNDRDPTVERLKKAASEWDANRPSDVPADESDLPDPAEREGEQTTIGGDG